MSSTVLWLNKVYKIISHVPTSQTLLLVAQKNCGLASVVQGDMDTFKEQCFCEACSTEGWFISVTTRIGNSSTLRLNWVKISWSSPKYSLGLWFCKWRLGMWEHRAKNMLCISFWVLVSFLKRFLEWRYQQEVNAIWISALKKKNGYIKFCNME